MTKSSIARARQAADQLSQPNWITTSLGEICEMENGDRGANYPSKRDFVDSGYPFVNAGNLDRGQIKTGDLDYLTSEKYAALRGGKYASGDLLFCLRGSLGKFALVGERDPIGAIASSLIIVRPRTGRVTSEYLAAYFDSDACATEVEKWAGGAAQPNLGGRDLARFQISLPRDAHVQSAITTAIGDIDLLARSLEALIIKKRQIRQGAAQALVSGVRRLPGFRQGWSTKSLGELCRLKSGEGITSKNIDDFSPYPCYGGNGVRGFARTFTHDGRFALIGRVGALCGNINFVEGRFFASEHAIVATARDGVSIEWLALVLDRMNLNQFSESSAQPVLTVSKLAKLFLFAPEDEAEQRAIADVVESMRRELSALEAKLAKVRQIREGMMRELLSGRIRLA